MLNKRGFNEWSGTYDESIVKGSHAYPFDGYYDLLGQIESIIGEYKNPEVLELGIGTGTLTLQLQKQGAKITGVDFFDQILMEARKKLGEVPLFQQDLREFEQYNDTFLWMR